jgi:hypothetical protein
MQPGGFWGLMQGTLDTALDDSAAAVNAWGLTSALATPTVPASSAEAHNAPARYRMHFRAPFAIMILFDWL